MLGCIIWLSTLTLGLLILTAVYVVNNIKEKKDHSLDMHLCDLEHKIKELEDKLNDL